MKRKHAQSSQVFAVVALMSHGSEVITALTPKSPQFWWRQVVPMAACLIEGWHLDVSETSVLGQVSNFARSKHWAGRSLLAIDRK